MVKKFTSILMGVLLLILLPVKTFAIESKVSPRNYWVNLFPEFQESLDKYTNGCNNAIAEDDKFIKLTQVDDTLRDSSNVKKGLDENGQVIYYKSEISTEYEYILQKNKPNLLGDGHEHGNVSNKNSWIRLNMQVYEGKTKNEYMAFSFYEWLTRPFFTFTDAHGVNFNHMVISEHAPIESLYRYRSPHDHNIYDDYPPIITNEKGVAAKPDILSYSGTIHNSVNMGMLQVPLSFPQYTPGSQHKGNVFTSYVHSEISPGNISLGADGKPSIEFGAEDRFELGKAIIVSDTYYCTDYCCN